ncbi:MAG: glutathione-disulfide reductase [Aestuariivirgaceae bacterium]
MSDYDYDLFVIGGGSGGVRAARIAAQHGARVAITEEYRYGGTCVIRGCVPKKLFVYASHFAEEFSDAAGFGWTVEGASFDWPTLVANKDVEIERLSKIYIANLEKAGVEIFRSRAELRDAHTIELTSEGRSVTAERILIAVGAAPFVPQFEGSVHAITSNEAFHLDHLPASITIVGGGYIAVEFAGIFNGLGVDTTLLYRGEQILRGFDDDLRNHLAAEMTKKGIIVHTGAHVEAIKQTAGGFTVVTDVGKPFETGLVMYATGRWPKIEGLGLDNAGIEVRDDGAIIVNGFSQTNVANIYAIGDVTHRMNLTPVAIREGHAFADTVYGDKPTAVDHANVATAVFSQPELGTVGLTEAKAREQFGEVDIYKSVFRPMKHTLSGSDEKMMMKLIVDAATDKVLGCHIMGPDAGEMAQLLGIAVKMGATKADFDATIAVHPTASEELVTMREKWTG